MEQVLVISAIIALVVIAGVLIYIKLTKPTEDQLNIWYEIQNKVSEQIPGMVDEVIAAYNPTDYADVSKFYKAVLNTMYDNIWKMAEDLIDTYFSTDSLGKRVMKHLLNKETIEGLLTNKSAITNRLIAIFETAYKEKYEQYVKEDVAAQKEAEAYENGSKPVPLYNGEFDKTEEDIARETPDIEHVNQEVSEVIDEN